MLFKNKEVTKAPVFSCDEVEFITVFAVSLLCGSSKAIDMYNSMSEEKRHSMDRFVTFQLIDALNNNLSLSALECAEIKMISMLGMRVITDASSCKTVIKMFIMNGMGCEVESAIEIANDIWR